MKKFLFYKVNLNTERVRKHPFFSVECENTDEARKAFNEKYTDDELLSLFKENETYIIK